MPKNKGRGGKNYRRGKNENQTKRELEFKEEGLEYAQVTKMLGNGRLEIYCFDNVKRIGHICGRLKKKVWIAMDDIVLVSLRDFQDEKCDIVLKYHPEEVRTLKQYGEIPENIKINEKGGEASADVVFEDSDDEEDEDEEEEDEDGNVRTITKPKPSKPIVEDSDEDSDEEDEDAEEKEEEPIKTFEDYKKSKKGELNIDDI